MTTNWVKQHKTAMAFIALAALLICAVAGYAAHIKDIDGTWKSIYYHIATGDHDWNDTDTYSYHYMNIENNSNVWVDVTYKWKHELKQGNTVLKSDEIGNKGRPLRIQSGDTYSTSGWLNTHTAGGIDAGNYKIVSSTKIKMKNENGFSQDWISISKTTDFDVPE